MSRTVLASWFIGKNRVKLRSAFLMAVAERTLPHWDMSVIYPGLESAEFQQGFQAALHAIDELVALFDQAQIGWRQGPHSRAQTRELEPEAQPLDDATQTFERVARRYNDALESLYTTSAYIS